jgi:hypothetical protein
MSIDDRLQGQIDLLAAIHKSLPRLEEVLAHAQSQWGSQDLFYRFYHHSFKVYGCNMVTAGIVEELQALAPERPLHSFFLAIVKDAAGRSFSEEVNSR